MTQNYGESYEATYLYGGGSCLLLNPDDEKTLLGVRKAIDESNIKAMNLGYKPRQYKIVKRQFIVVHDEDGQFVMSTVVRMAMETYPESIEDGGE